MERLLEKLKALMKQYNITNYTVCKKTGIGQSHLSMIFSGKRSIRPAQFYAILNQLPMPIESKNELIDEFRKLYYTNEEYLSLKYIHDMLKQLSDLTANHSDDVPSEEPENPDTNYKDTIYRGTDIPIVIYNLLARDFATGADAVYIYMPSVGNNTKTLKTIITSLARKAKHTTKLITFVDYIGMPKGSIENLETLTRLIPLGLADNTDSYRFYYTNVHSLINENYTTPYPYFIAFSDKIAFVNVSCDEIVLYSDPETVRNVRMRCEGRTKQYKKLMEVNSTVYDMITEVIANQGSADSFCSLEYEPCLVMHFTEELVDNVIRTDLPHRNMFFALAITRLKQLKNFKKTLRIFNQNSLMDFARTGRVHELAPEHARALTPPERLIILKDMLEISNSKNHILQALNPSTMFLSERVSIYQSNDFVLFSLWDDANIPQKYFTIYEKSICDSFRNFLEHLSNSNFVYSAEDTRELLINAIKYVETLC